MEQDLFVYIEYILFLLKLISPYTNGFDTILVVASDFNGGSQVSQARSMVLFISPAAWVLSRYIIDCPISSHCLFSHHGLTSSLTKPCRKISKLAVSAQIHFRQDFYFGVLAFAIPPLLLITLKMVGEFWMSMSLFHTNSPNSIFQIQI